MLAYLRNLSVSLAHSESGVTTVEYALLLALIMVFCISAILNTGDVQDALWFNTASTLEVINEP